VQYRLLEPTTGRAPLSQPVVAPAAVASRGGVLHTLIRLVRTARRGADLTRAAEIA
jgi:hypothetical protein